MDCKICKNLGHSDECDCMLPDIALLALFATLYIATFCWGLFS